MHDVIFTDRNTAIPQIGVTMYAHITFDNAVGQSSRLYGIESTVEFDPAIADVIREIVGSPNLGVFCKLAQTENYSEYIVPVVIDFLTSNMVGKLAVLAGLMHQDAIGIMVAADPSTGRQNVQTSRLVGPGSNDWHTDNGTGGWDLAKELYTAEVFDLVLKHNARPIVGLPTA